MLDTMRRRTTAAVAATALLGAGAAVVAAGRWASGTTLATRRTASGPPGFPASGLVVHGTAAGRITLTRSLASRRPGTYGLVGADCRAVVGPVLDISDAADTVVRRLERVDRGRLDPGTPVHLTPQLHVGDPQTALGIPYSDVSIPGELGTLPAWFVPGTRDTWVITLHGLGLTREHLLNVLPFLHEQGFPTLMPSYRGDPDAPPPPDRKNRLGAGEWPDADAALRYAIRFGARRIVLYGWSTGGAMALYTADRSQARARVGGVVLDSPVLDQAATLRSLAEHRGIPAPLVPLAVGAARGGLGINGAAAPPGNPRGPGGTPVPVLLLHGPDDTVAPWQASQNLAARHPESVTLHGVADAQHAAMWNVDPEGYEETLRRFLTPLM